MARKSTLFEAFREAESFVKYWESLTGRQVKAKTPHLSVYTVSASSYEEALLKVQENRYTRLLEKVRYILRSKIKEARKLFADDKLARLLLPLRDPRKDSTRDPLSDPLKNLDDILPIITQLKRLLRGEDPGNPDPADYAPEFISLEDAEREFIGKSESDAHELAPGCRWLRNSRDPED